MNMVNNAGEQMLSEIVSAVYEYLPSVNVEKIKTTLSGIFSKYHVKKVDVNEARPDITEKIELFLSSKN